MRLRPRGVVVGDLNCQLSFRARNGRVSDENET